MNEVIIAKYRKIGTYLFWLMYIFVILVSYFSTEKIGAGRVVFSILKSFLLSGVGFAVLSIFLRTGRFFLLYSLFSAGNLAILFLIYYYASPEKSAFYQVIAALWLDVDLYFFLSVPLCATFHLVGRVFFQPR